MPIRLFDRKRRPPRDAGEPTGYLTQEQVCEKIASLPEGLYGVVLVKTDQGYHLAALDLPKLEEFFNSSLGITELALQARGRVKELENKRGY